MAMHFVKWAWAIGFLALSLFVPNQPLMAADLASEDYEINTVLMETTFRIEGKSTNGTKNGTVFILGKPASDDSPKGRYVLVTAAHVLDGINGDFALLHLRERKDGNGWKQFSLPLKIREKEVALWTKHPEADVAVMYLPPLPEGVIPLQLATTLLADDDVLEEFAIHPGDSLNCLGFPLGLDLIEDGFPILRSGKIASYPLLPTKRSKTFLADFEVFAGHSGGPVYFVDSNRFYKHKAHMGQKLQFVMGLVSAEYVFQQDVTELYSESKHAYPLKLAYVVHASLIKAAIALLP